jgi:hypothetical protein
MSTSCLPAKPDAYTESFLQRYRDSFWAFVSELTIPYKAGEAVFSEVWADFQQEWFLSVASSLEMLAAGGEPPRRRFWVERTKGASKDSDLACCLLWLLAFTPRGLHCQAGAADQEQADELRKAMEGICRLNLWLGDIVQVQNWRVVNERTGSECNIMTSDNRGSHGSPTGW